MSDPASILILEAGSALASRPGFSRLGFGSLQCKWIAWSLFSVTIVEDESSTIVFGADSGPTNRIWEIARNINHLKTAFIEVSLPRELQELALRIGHLIPDLLKKEIAKLPENTSIFATHIKPKYQKKIIEELKSLELKQLDIGTSSKEYVY